jgi:integrase
MAKLEPRYRSAADKKAGRVSGYAGVWYDPRRRPSRKYITLRTRDETTARQRLTVLEKKEALGLWSPWDDHAPEHGVTVEKAIPRYIAYQRKKGRSPATLKTSEDILTRFERSLLAGLPVAHVERRHVEAFLARKKKDGGDRRASAKGRYLAVILHFARWAMRKGLAPSAFAEGVELPTGRPNRREHLTEAEEAAILRAIDAAEIVDGRSQRWLRDWLQFATRTGLRPGEQAALK